MLSNDNLLSIINNDALRELAEIQSFSCGLLRQNFTGHLLGISCEIGTAIKPSFGIEPLLNMQ